MSDQPLRILQILRAPVGGLFRHVSDLTQELAARGHEIGIVTDNLTSDALTEAKLAKLAPLAKLGIYNFSMPRVVGAGDFFTPFAIRRLAEKLGADVLHGHGAKGGFNARLSRMGRNGRVALYTPHGGVLNYRPGSLTGALFRRLERTLLGQTDAVIFESAFARQAFHETIGVPTCPGPVIYNGLAPAEFEPITPDADASDFVFIGEFRAVKGISVLLDALVGVRAPDGRPATLAMAGGGPDLPKVEAQIAALGLADRVKLLGVQPARQALRQGRCEVVPSLAESLPYVILEAASAARPVISTHVGGIAEIFGPTAGSLLPPSDVPALRSAMQGYMDNPTAAEREMRQRLDYIRPRFSVAHMTDQIETLYRAVLTTRRGPELRPESGI